VLGLGLGLALVLVLELGLGLRMFDCLLNAKSNHILATMATSSVATPRTTTRTTIHTIGLTVSIYKKLDQQLLGLVFIFTFILEMTHLLKL